VEEKYSFLGTPGRQGETKKNHERENRRKRVESSPRNKKLGEERKGDKEVSNYEGEKIGPLGLRRGGDVSATTVDQQKTEVK